MTRVLLVGSGGREHAIAWKLRQSPDLSDLWIAPGNGGTAELAENVPIPANDIDSLVKVAKERRADLVIVGPEEPLALGLTNALERAGIACLGPTQAAAQIESSKSFAKDIMERSGVATAKWRTFDAYEPARSYISEHPLPLVVKADGLAAGKGVAVCNTHDEALRFLDEVMHARAFGDAGSRVIVEEALVGMEASAFALCDGERVLMTVPACDYKRIDDDDRGSNTGGMGSYSPPEFLDDSAIQSIQSDVFEPVLRRMAADGNPYKGVIYAGLMMTADGPKVLEFNCRMGDPETQVVLPRMSSDLLPVAQAAATGSLAGVDMTWKPQPSTGVVLTSGGYPGEYRRGIPIAGLNDIDSDVLVFHAGTKLDDSGQLVTNGGRVLTIVALGDTMAEARERAYANASRVRFEGVHYRKDIALRVAESGVHT